MTVAQKEKRLQAELALLADAPARLDWLIERARARPLLPGEWRVDSNRVEEKTLPSTLNHGNTR